jgi:glycerol-3-phosphate acyltransferase PlsY
VATAAGVAFALAVWLGVALLGVWLAFALVFRISSLASMAAAVAAPLLGLYFIGNGPEAWALFPIALLLISRHRENIRKLLAGQERRIGS